MLPYHYEIDEKTAPYVKMIFEWKSLGKGNQEICRKLNEIEAITPTQRKFELGLLKNENSVATQWSFSCGSIMHILKNRMYTGCLIYGRAEQSLYQGVQQHENPPEKWMILPNKHEAIINEEVFHHVQMIIAEQQLLYNQKMEEVQKESSKIINIFKGKAFCADCGKRLCFYRRKSKKTKRFTYQASFFECRDYDRFKICKRHKIYYMELYNSILDMIQCQQKDILEQAEIPMSNVEFNLQFYTNKHNKIVKELDIINAERKQLFEDFTTQILEKSEYIVRKKTYDELAKELKKQLNDIITQKEAMKNILSTSKYQKELITLEEIKELTQEIVDTMIQKIIIGENKKIQIEWNFNKQINISDNEKEEMLLK